MPPEMLLWVLAGVLVAAVCLMYREKQNNCIKPRAAFRATRLTQSTFLLSEYNDIYDEQPQIFVKLIPSANTILIIDTGCGGATIDHDIEITSLRRYIEQVRLDCNNGIPLNEGGCMEYLVVATHCHYDHILGMEQFADSRILASSHSPSFISQPNLPANSLCESMGIRTPSYTPILVPHAYTVKSSALISLGVSIFHTPGHTPDELALYDTVEKMLYVGDSLYEKATIIFPREGSIVAWVSSMEFLLDFVRAENKFGGKEVLINSGHETVCRPALEVLDEAKRFMEDVILAREPVRQRLCRRGEENVRYVQQGGRFALLCPERLVLEARGLKQV